MKNKWAWIFGSGFLLGLFLLVYLINPQNLFERSAYSNDKGESLNGEIKIFLTLLNCEYQSCGQSLLSKETTTKWNQIDFQFFSYPERAPASVWNQMDQDDSKMEDILFTLGQAAKAHGFPWELLEEVNSSNKPIVGGFWPEIKQTYSILKGYFSTSTSQSKVLHFGHHLYSEQEWENLLFLISKLRLNQDKKMNLKWYIVGLNKRGPTFVATEYSDKDFENIITSTRNPYAFLNLMLNEDLSEGRFPAQNKNSENEKN